MLPDDAAQPPSHLSSPLPRGAATAGQQGGPSEPAGTRDADFGSHRDLVNAALRQVGPGSRLVISFAWPST